MSAVSVKSVTRASPHSQVAIITNVTGLSYTRTRNAAGEAVFRVPVTSIHLGNLRPWEDEVRIEYDPTASSTTTADTRFWGVVVDRTVTGSFVEVRCYDILHYLSRRYVGDHDRTNQITNGNFTSGTLGQSPPPNWTEAGSNLNAYNANTIVPMVGSFYAEVTHTTRVVDKRADGADVDSPSDPEDYHGPDESIFQNGLSTPDGGVIIMRGWSYIREDATFGYGGKAFDRRGLFAEVLNSGGDVIRGYQSPLDDNTPRNQWVRHELEIIAEPGGTVNFRLYGIGAGAKASAVAWDGVGAFFMESLSFASGTDVLDIIEGLLDHAQDTSFGKSALSITGDPANSATGVTSTQIAYQHVDHRNVWDAMLDYCSPRRDSGTVELRTSWNTAASARYLRVVPTPSTGNGETMTMGSSLTAVDYNESGSGVTTRVLAAGPGSGPDREEAQATDTSEVAGLVLEDIISVPDDLPLSFYAAYADGYVYKKKEPVKTLRVAAVDSDRGSGSWADTNPGELVAFTGSYGPFSYSAKLLRVLSVTHDVDAGRFVFELTEEPSL